MISHITKILREDQPLLLLTNLQQSEVNSFITPFRNINTIKEQVNRKTIIVVDSEDRDYPAISSCGSGDIATYTVSVTAFTCDENILNALPDAIYKAVEGKVINGIPIHLGSFGVNDVEHSSELGCFSESITFSFTHNSFN